ncbi:substrate-binding domain-containing protein [Rubellimicrobium sp. CFH 75288]|uniref:substrate-binding domain-containing protein n=1 Tax=Rubellimicrobium sp. CFH 75288 TaxID=2697034 RepID=UPI001412E45C|nr:substrate-binding domain-containing protein [Rubellimicrobium sp. CFH 75288]NAZ38268.1 substrate-binding domain-containing protein [Rubellimicrobium sp. CFH 75288]
MSIAGLGPHGERASPPQRVALSSADVEAARRMGFRVAIVMHTLESDFARQQLQGLAGTLGDCGTAVIEVVDCGFSPEAQIAALDRLVIEAPDAVISLPVANAAVAAAHARLSEVGIAVVLLDNVPTGLLPGKHYVALVSADNSGLGRIAAELLAPHLPEGAEIGVLGYDADFFATDERELAFERWMRRERPDIMLRTARFSSIPVAGETALSLFAAHSALSGLFVVWDTPAREALSALSRHGWTGPVATIDLGRDAAVSLASGGPIVAVAAQQPYQQGVTAAQTAILAMLGQLTPDWIALPGLPVTRANVVESFQAVWRRPAPLDVLTRLMQDRGAG